MQPRTFILLLGTFLPIQTILGVNQPTPPGVSVKIAPIHVNDDDDTEAGSNDVIDINESDRDLGDGNEGEISEVRITLTKLANDESVEKYGAGTIKITLESGRELIRLWKNGDRSEEIGVGSDGVIMEEAIRNLSSRTYS